MTEPIKSFRDLIVWQRAVQLSAAIYEMTEQFPSTERFGLIDQMRRASVSVVSNIAEGRHQGTRKSFLHFLRIAYGSVAELEAQMCIIEQLVWSRKCNLQKSKALLKETAKMLNTMITNLKKIPDRS